MKKLFFVLLCLFLTASLVRSQSFEIVPTVGYTFADRFHIPRGEAKIGDAFSYGATLSYVASSRLSLDLTWTGMSCDSWARSSHYDLNTAGTVNANYILIGTTKYFPLNQEARLFTGAGIGVGIFSGKDDDLGSSTKFAVGVKGGFKYDIAPNAGFVLQASLNMPVGDVGAGLWWNVGSGPSIAVSSSSPFFQFGLSGGFVIRFGDKSQKKKVEPTPVQPEQQQQQNTMPLYYE